MNLKKALEQGRLKQFIKDNEHHVGNKARFDKLLTSMVSGKSKATQAKSSRASCENYWEYETELKEKTNENRSD